jgi:catalase
MSIEIKLRRKIMKEIRKFLFLMIFSMYFIIPVFAQDDLQNSAMDEIAIRENCYEVMSEEQQAQIVDEVTTPKWNAMTRKIIGRRISEKWAKLSPEQKKAAIEEAKKKWNLLSEKKKQHIRKRAREKWNSLSEEEKDVLRNRWNKKWMNLSKEQREQIRQKAREKWNSLSDDEKKQIMQKVKEKWSKMSKEEKQKMREIINERWKSYTE